MNKRIKELVDQAGFIRFSPKEDPRTPIDWSCEYSTELNQFAELIVRECATVVASVSPCFGDYRDQIEVNLRDYCAKKIMEHFGVEE